MTAKTKTKPKPKAKPTTKTKAKAKARTKPKAKPASKAEPVADVVSAAPPGATGFEDVRWGMTRAEIAARYKVTSSKYNAKMDTEINGVPVSVNFVFDKDRLFIIDVSSRNRYPEWGDADGDQHALIEWITKAVGNYTERSSAGARWVLPTTTIRTYADEALTVSFKKPA